MRQSPAHAASATACISSTRRAGVGGPARPASSIAKGTIPYSVGSNCVRTHRARRAFCVKAKGFTSEIIQTAVT